MHLWRFNHWLSLLFDSPLRTTLRRISQMSASRWQQRTSPGPRLRPTSRVLRSGQRYLHYDCQLGLLLITGCNESCIDNMGSVNLHGAKEIRCLQRTGDVFSDMVDCYPKETRSRVMSKIRSKQTQPEILLRKCLWRRGWKGYRINIKGPPGKPDIVFRSQKVAIFIDGCFWHKCPMCFVEPKSNREYWLPKIEKNVARDQVANEQLQKMGWKVIRIWEHEVKEDVEKCAEKIIKQICSKNE